jgi:hypothetical protein
LITIFFILLLNSYNSYSYSFLSSGWDVESYEAMINNGYKTVRISLVDKSGSRIRREEILCIAL